MANDLNETNGLNGTGNVGNGNPLPAAREAVIEQAQRVYQEVAHDRDQLRQKLFEASSAIAGYKVALEAQTSQLAAMDSRVAEAIAVRDEAVARRASLEAVLATVLATLRTFDIEHAPLVKIREWQDDQQARQDAVNRAGLRNTLA